MSLEGLSENQIQHQVEEGDLRPQINPHAPVTWDAAASGLEPAAVVSALTNRFFQLARPITDSSQEPAARPESRLQDAGRFFYLVETLNRLGCQRVEETLFMLLDDFSQLEQRSYDELYLWSIVHLSRTRPECVETFWPLAITLDLRFRPSPWRRPPDVSLVEQPYRLTELVLYYYVLYTLEREVPPDLPLEGNSSLPAWPHSKRRYTSLATCLRRFFDQLGEEQKSLLLETLRDLAREQKRPAFGDAHGLLLKVR